MQNIDDWQNKFKECYCSNKLLNKIKVINKKFIANQINLISIKKAIYYANEYHGKQRKLSAESHYCHPLELASMAVDYLFDADIISVVILQDMIVDRLLTKEELSVIFNAKIAGCLEELAIIKNNKNNKFIDSVLLLNKKKKCCPLFVLCLNKLYSLYYLEALPDEVHRDLVLESLQAVQIISSYLKKNQSTKDIHPENYVPILAKIC